MSPMWVLSCPIQKSPGETGLFLGAPANFMLKTHKGRLIGGGREIRTPVRLAPPTDFESGPFDQLRHPSAEGKL